MFKKLILSFSIFLMSQLAYPICPICPLGPVICPGCAVIVPSVFEYVMLATGIGGITAGAVAVSLDEDGNPLPPKLNSFFFDNLTWETQTEVLNMGSFSLKDNTYSSNLSLKYATKSFYNFHPYVNVNTNFKEHQVQAGFDYFLRDHLKAYMEMALRHKDQSSFEKDALMSLGMMYYYKYKKLYMYFGAHYELSLKTKDSYFMPYVQVSFPVFKKSEVFLMSSLNTKPELKLAYQFIF